MTSTSAVEGKDRCRKLWYEWKRHDKWWSRFTSLVDQEKSSVLSYCYFDKW